MPARHKPLSATMAKTARLIGGGGDGCPGCGGQRQRRRDHVPNLLSPLASSAKGSEAFERLAN